MRLQKCRSGSLVHVYQRTINGFLLFYTARDCLAFFTIFSTRAKKYPVRIVSLCLMPDHIHFCAEVGNHEDLAAFIKEYSEMYSRAFNKSIMGSGSVFKGSFGMANKSKDKSKRSCIIYILNNPVEKKLSQRALDYKWNFLGYAFGDYPFSHKLVLSAVSRRLRRALRMVDMYHAKGLYLTYNALARLADGLSGHEREQFTDYVVQAYNIIDYTRMASFFKTFESLVIATDSSTGSEYDICEDKSFYSDRVYSRISRFFIERCGIVDPKDSLMLNEDEKRRIAERIVAEGIATPVQICKYLRLP